MCFPELQSQDPYVLPLWYTTVLVYCAAFGVFLLSWASLYPTTELELQGFNCGDEPDDDFSSQFSTKIMI